MFTACFETGSPFMAVSQMADNNVDAGVRPKSTGTFPMATAPTATATSGSNGSTMVEVNAKLLRTSLTRTPRDPPS